MYIYIYWASAVLILSSWAALSSLRQAQLLLACRSVCVGYVLAIKAGMFCVLADQHLGDLFVQVHRQ